MTPTPAGGPFQEQVFWYHQAHNLGAYHRKEILTVWHENNFAVWN